MSLTPARSEALALFGQKGAFCNDLNKMLCLFAFYPYVIKLTIENFKYLKEDEFL